MALFGDIAGTLETDSGRRFKTVPHSHPHQDGTPTVRIFEVVDGELQMRIGRCRLKDAMPYINTVKGKLVEDNGS